MNEINQTVKTITPNHEVVTITPITCKNCGSEGVVKFGTYKGVQRYYCKACKRKFKADDSLFHMKVSADYISTAFYPSVTIGKYIIGVAPSGFRLSQKNPFCNGDDIFFDLIVIVPFSQPKTNVFQQDPHIDENFAFSWDFFDRDENRIILEPTQNTYHLENRKKKEQSSNTRKVYFDSGVNGVRFTIPRAIHIGHLWEFHRYDLRLISESGQRDIIAEFTLRDIDEHGESYRMLLLSLILGAGISFTVALVTVLIFGRYL